MKKRNLVASALAVGLAAVSVIGLAACDTPDDGAKEIVFPEGAVMTADGIFETDIVDPWETEVRLTGDEGKRIEIVSGYLNGNSVGTTIVVKNHSDEGKVSPMPGIAERNDTYEWQPQGMPYFEWLEKVQNAADRSAMAALRAREKGPCMQMMWAGGTPSSRQRLRESGLGSTRGNTRSRRPGTA